MKAWATIGLASTMVPMLIPQTAKIIDVHHRLSFLTLSRDLPSMIADISSTKTPKR